MANHTSAKKRARQTVKRTLNNKVKNSKVKSVLKTIRAAITGKEKVKAQELLPDAQALLSKLARVGYIKPNKAARTTSRLTTQVNSL